LTAGSHVVTPTVILSPQDLWGDVVGRPTECAGGVTWSDSLLKQNLV